MIEDLMNQVRRAAAEASHSSAITRHGTISSYDPNSHAVKVQLQPDGTLTGWIPLKSHWVGAGWGAVFAPAIGTAVEVHFQEADGGVGSAGLSFFNDVERPPSAPSGEGWLVHQSGTSIKLTNDGAATIDTGQGASIKVQGNAITSVGTWAHQGNLTVTGGDVVADSISLKQHVHAGVKAGGDTSGKPVQ